MRKDNIKQQLRSYFDLLRPFTLLAPIIVSICIMIASFFYNNNTGDIFILFWTTVIPASITLAILNSASNTLNQVTDYKTDKISKPYRPLPNGKVTLHEAKILSVILYFSAIILSLYVNFMFAFFTLLITIFTISYSLPPRLKDFLFLNQLWIGIPRGLLGIMASWSVFGNALHPLPLTIGLIAMFFLMGGSCTKDLTDGYADKITGTRTIINTFGIKKSALIALPFMFFPFALIPLLIEFGLLDPYLWLLTFLAIPSYLIFYLMFSEEKGSKLLENTSAWALMYITYFIFASGFSFLTIIGTLFS
jgi:4-hydroxybenzoate polyprenyltransferase